MQISTSSLYAQAQRQMGALTDSANTLETQISTGKRLADPADDVVAYQRLAAIRRDTADAATDKANVSLASSLLQQTDTTLSSVSSEIQRAQELATQANSGILSDSDKAAIATSIRGVLADLVSLANSKDARGAPLFGGTGGADAVSLNADGSANFPSDAPASISVGSGQNVQPTESAARVFGGIPGAAGGTTDLFQILATLADALDAGGDTSAAASRAVSDLDSAGKQAAAVQASVGARAARLDLIQQQQATATTDREATRSNLEDTDVTAAITELQKTMTVLQATQASFTKLSSLSLFDYLR